MKPALERNVGDQTDQSGQRLRHQSGAGRDHDRDQADENYTAVDDGRLYRCARCRQHGRRRGVHRNTGGGGGFRETSCGLDLGGWGVVRVRQASLSYHDVGQKELAGETPTLLRR